MKRAVLLVILATFGLSSALVSVNYRIEFSAQCVGTDNSNSTIVVMVPVYNTIQSVMETAFRQNSSYQFQLKYSPALSGYIVSELVGVSNTDTCRWMVYISAPEVENEYLVDGAVDKFHVPSNYAVILRYEMGVAMITTYYSIEYPDPACHTNSYNISTVSVITQEDTTALDVMESAALLDKRHEFSIRRSSSGYVIQELDGNERTDQCVWMAYYSESRGGMENLVPGSVAEFQIPEGNGELIMKFVERLFTLPTPMEEVATTTGAAQGHHGVPTMLMVVPVIMLVIFTLAF